MKLTVDQRKCIGSGHCVVAAPEVFDQRDDDGLVELLDPEPPESQERAVREALWRCPSGAISEVSE